METNRPIGIGAGLPTSPDGLEPGKIDYNYTLRSDLMDFGIKLDSLPKETRDFSIEDLRKVIKIIADTIADIVSSYGFIKRILVGLGIIKPLSKEEKIDIIKSYALNKK